MMIRKLSPKQHSLAHAQHNEKVCELLYENGEFNDWVITSAFYTAMYYLEFAMFPFEFTSDQRMQEEAHSFAEYCAITHKRGKKHSVFKKLVRNRCPKHIAVDYCRMLDASYISRYQQYNFLDSITATVRSRLFRIKAYAA